MSNLSLSTHFSQKVNFCSSNKKFHLTDVLLHPLFSTAPYAQEYFPIFLLTINKNRLLINSYLVPILKFPNSVVMLLQCTYAEIFQMPKSKHEADFQFVYMSPLEKMSCSQASGPGLKNLDVSYYKHTLFTHGQCASEQNNCNTRP